MNCRDVTPLLSAERDGPLDAAVRPAMEQHVAACPVCQRTRATLAEAATAWRETSSLATAPDPAGEWRVLRARLRTGDTGSHSRPTFPGWLVRVGAIPLAATAAWIALLALNPAVPSANQYAPAIVARAASTAAHADYVETSDDASPLIYVDQESGWLIVWAESPSSG